MVSLRTQRRLLYLLTAALAASAGVCVVVSLVTDLEAPVTQSKLPPASAVTESTERGSLPPLSSFAQAWRRDLRPPLFDPPPPRPAAPPPKPPLSLTLVGTIVEPGFTYGVFRTAGGEEKLIGVGQTIDGAEVVTVADGSAQVRFNGELVTLQAPREGQQ